MAGTGTLWRLASSESDGQNPSITRLPLASLPDSFTVPRFSVNIYELAAK